MRWAVVVPAVLLAAAAPIVAAAQIQIDHAAVSCVVAEKFPRLEAHVVPPDAVARAVVHFRTDATGPWYAVAMKRDGESLSGVLPKPKKTLPAFHYYIDVTDRAFAASRTPEYKAVVVGGPGGCKGKMMAAALGSASVLLEGPAGAALVPAGFGSAGVTAAGSGTAAVTSAGAAGGGGVGIGTVAAIVAGGAAVAGAAVVASSGGGDESEGGEGARVSNVIYSVLFPLPGLDLASCAGRPLNWTSQVVSVDAAGRFDNTWAPSEPGLLRVTGTVTETAFNASLACTSGNTTGTVSATGGGGTYQGTFRFGSSSGPATVVRQ